MPGSTAKLQLPYPLGTDPISDGDDQIKALAERVEAVLIPAWIPMTLQGGWTHQSGDPAQYRKVGDNVELRGSVLSTSGSASGQWIWAVPAGPPSYRPPKTTRLGSVAISATAVTKAQQLTITTSGGNAFYLTVEYDSVAIGAGGLVALEGLTYSTTA